jgi:hypothetical protein
MTLTPFSGPVGSVSHVNFGHFAISALPKALHRQLAYLSVQLRDNWETQMANFDASAPVIIGVGEASRKTVAGEWPAPRELAGAAIKVALTDTGQSEGVAAAIDTIAAIRTFEDSGLSLGTGSPDNAPEAFGAAGGISATRLIYADVGGQSPQGDTDTAFDSGETTEGTAC